MSKECMDCCERVDGELHSDPRTPPLDTEPCLCETCLRAALEELAEEASGAVDDYRSRIDAIDEARGDVSRMVREKPLDASFLLFNGHINNADARARELLRRTNAEVLAEVERIEEEQNGIMWIFDVEPTEATRMFATLVFAYVNEEIGDA